MKVKNTLDDYKIFWNRFEKKKNILLKNVMFVIGPIIALSFALNGTAMYNYMVSDGIKYPEAQIADNLALLLGYNLIIMLLLIFVIRFAVIKLTLRKMKTYFAFDKEFELELGSKSITIIKDNIKTEIDFKGIFQFLKEPNYYYIILYDKRHIIVPINIESEAFMKKFEENFVEFKNS